MILKSHFCDLSWSNFSSRNAKNISKTYGIISILLKEIKQGKQRLKVLVKSEAVIQRFLGLNFWKILKIVCDRVITVTFCNTERPSAKGILRMAIRYNTMSAFRTLPNIYDVVFLKKFSICYRYLTIS